MFKGIEIKTFNLEDLTGKTLEIRSFCNNDSGTELIIGRDIKSGELYLMKEINHPMPTKS